MTKEARPVLPTDLLALVTYQGRSYRNEAWPRERVGAAESQGPLGLVLAKFLAFARGRSAWISVRRQRLRGLVGARRRGGRQAWEVDYLIDATPAQDAAAGLLEAAAAGVGRAGAEKLFLRLAADSELLPVVLDAGFIAYQEETLYARAARPEAEPALTALRPVQPADSYLLFRLYNATTPESTRRAGGGPLGRGDPPPERGWLEENRRG